MAAASLNLISDLDRAIKTNRLELNPNASATKKGLDVAGWLGKWFRTVGLEAGATAVAEVMRDQGKRAEFFALLGIKDAQAVNKAATALEAALVHIQSGVKETFKMAAGLDLTHSLTGYTKAGVHTAGQTLATYANSCRGTLTSPGNDGEMKLILKIILDETRSLSQKQGIGFRQAFEQVLANNAEESRLAGEPSYSARLPKDFVLAQASAIKEFAKKVNVVNAFVINADLRKDFTAGDLAESEALWAKIPSEEQAKIIQSSEALVETLSEMKQSGMNMEISDPNLKAYLTIQAHKAEAIAQERKTEFSLATMFEKLPEGSITQILVTSMLGFFGGSMFGFPALGVVLSGLVSILGSLGEGEPDATLAKKPPERAQRRASARLTEAAL